jgi:peptide deformylase
VSKITYFGNPVLRKKSKKLSKLDIKSAETTALIKKLESLVKSEEYGVGLAAPQIGISKSISFIFIKPTPTRPNLTRAQKGDYQCQL